MTDKPPKSLRVHLRNVDDVSRLSAQLHGELGAAQAGRPVDTVTLIQDAIAVCDYLSEAFRLIEGYERQLRSAFGYRPEGHGD